MMTKTHTILRARSAKMGLQISALAIPLLLIGGCETAKRFAPPGFVKYEDIAQGIPVDPAIQKRIDENIVDEDAKYPVLSETPREIPEAESKRVRDLTTRNLLAVREVVNQDIAAARTQAEAELDVDTVGGASLGGETRKLAQDAQAFGQAVEDEREKAREEAAIPLPEPLDTSAAPKQSDDF